AGARTSPDRADVPAHRIRHLRRQAFVGPVRGAERVALLVRWTLVAVAVQPFHPQRRLVVHDVQIRHLGERREGKRDRRDRPAEGGRGAGGFAGAELQWAVAAVGVVRRSDHDRLAHGGQSRCGAGTDSGAWLCIRVRGHWSPPITSGSNPRSGYSPAEPLLAYARIRRSRPSRRDLRDLVVRRFSPRPLRQYVICSTTSISGRLTATMKTIACSIIALPPGGGCHLAPVYGSAAR